MFNIRNIRDRLGLNNDPAVPVVNTLRCSSCRKFIDTNAEPTIAPSCNHECCKECVVTTVTEAINDCNFDGVKCPAECEQPIGKDILQNILEPDLFAKYEILAEAYARIFGIDSKKTLCPKCKGSVETESEGFYASCNNCEFVFCTKCKTDYHGFICEDDEEEITEDILHQIPLGAMSLDSDPGNGAKISENVATMSSQPNGKTLTFTCNICFTDKELEDAVRFDCGHRTSCTACVKGFFESLIDDGNVHGLKCPETNCKTQASQKLVKDTVDFTKFVKYDELLLNEALGDFPEIVNCPNCQMRVTADFDGYCEHCDFRFCTECNQPFHGVTQCGLSEAERKAEIKRYLKATEAERLRLEQVAISTRKKQNNDSEYLIRRLYKKCPSCRADIEKTMGCNHMTCTRCGRHFCWLCLKLVSSDHHQHFNEPGSRCALFYVPPE
jgi:hypothetical protein